MGICQMFFQDKTFFFGSFYEECISSKSQAFINLLMRLELPIYQNNDDEPIENYHLTAGVYYF